ncbi:hypothetical protein CONLIGDRAFT_694032 [Coniochaeta ligniaria NRRL 30616]|uniref:Uncharacterized protein n=1 Tax=Coniochaeta ligniaria NRRL 30616 TaxID=1408157 RepID=A0A1J7I6K3_9PEZI|nr:hypothetical protein CONLIGDRAFT_694032 [Coniochaeta ligniaria NRRL 30616]
MASTPASEDVDSAQGVVSADNTSRYASLQGTISPMFNKVGLQPPKDPKLHLWSALCSAVDRKRPLRDELNPSLVTFHAFDGHIPTLSEVQDRRPPANATTDDQFAYVFRVIKRTTGVSKPEYAIAARPAYSAT